MESISSCLQIQGFERLLPRSGAETSEPQVNSLSPFSFTSSSTY